MYLESLSRYVPKLAKLRSFRITVESWKAHEEMTGLESEATRDVLISTAHV